MTFVNIICGISFFGGILIAGSNGPYFPIANTIGVAVCGLSCILIYLFNE